MRRGPLLRLQEHGPGAPNIEMGPAVGEGQVHLSPAVVVEAVVGLRVGRQAVGGDDCQEGGRGGDKWG